jgi:hypothetical protein
LFPSIHPSVLPSVFDSFLLSFHACYSPPFYAITMITIKTTK